MSNTQFKDLNVTLTNVECQHARMYAGIQELCSIFLTEHCDSFRHSIDFGQTKTMHEYYSWYIAVDAFKKNLTNYRNISVKTCWDSMDIQKIWSIITKKTPTTDDVSYIRSYFCNKYHINIESSGQKVFYDIRMATTQLKPQPYWDFLFDRDRANTRRNDIILLHCIGSKDVVNRVIFSGIILDETLKRCQILKKGQITKLGIISRVDSYITTLNKHYIY